MQVRTGKTERGGRRWVTVAAGGVLGATIVMLVLAGTWSAARADLFDAPVWRGGVAAAATLTALAAAALLFMWWRNQLAAPALWWSLAMASIGAASSIEFWEVLAEPGSLPRLVGALSVVVIGLAAFFTIKAVTSAQIDLTSVSRGVVGTAIAVAVAAGMAGWLVRSGWLSLIGWTVVAAIALFGSYRSRDTLAGWFGVGVLAVLQHEIIRFDANPDALVAVGSGVILELGLVLVLLGVFAHVEGAHTDLERRVSAADARVHLLRLARRADLNESEQRLHEARSALAALEHATRLLPVVAGSLPLRDAIRAEVALLRRLVTPKPTEHQPFRVADALAGAIAVERLYGVEIRVRVPPLLEAYGDLSGVAETAQCLLENARIHAAGSPIEVVASRVGDEVHISVTDDGPGIDAAVLSQIFDRGFTTGGGNGLGLGIAKAIIEQQGGRLWCDGAVPAGTRFVVALPAAPLSGEAGDKLDEVAGPADRGSLTATGLVDDRSTPRRVVEGDRDLSI